MFRKLLWAVVGASTVLGLVLVVQPASTNPVESGDFTHKSHIDKGLKDCSGCHGASNDGKVSAPGSNHEPCNGCHADEFRRPDSQLCFACHDSNEPWRKDNPVKSLGGGGSDFVAGFSHKAHTSRIATFKDGGGCATCHPVQSGKAERKTSVPTQGRAFLPKAHADCAKCHKSIAPNMGDCAACHILPTDKNNARGTDPKWRVSAKFTHKSHLDRGQTCDNCHSGVLEAEAGQAIPKPTMKSCGTCHNGKSAFKTTGHECSKCHGPKRR